MSSISYPLTIPDHADIEAFTMSPLAFVAAARSPFTGVQQIHEFPGQLWQVDVQVSMMSRVGADQWTAFLMALNGRAGTFLMGDPSAGVPRGDARLYPVAEVYGINSVDQLSIICSAAGGSTGYLLRGDYIQIGLAGATHLHRVLFDAPCNSDGIASLQIWPRLRATPSSGEACYVQSCVGIWRLAGNTMSWTEAPMIYSDIAFQAIEALS